MSTTELVVRVTLVPLAVAGALSARTMYVKNVMAAAGRLQESSIVELPEARLFFNVPNAAFGIGYYVLVLIAAAAGNRAIDILAAATSIVALATSAYLGFQLVRQHLECGRCWTAHVVNALLCPLLIVLAILSR